MHNNAPTTERFKPAGHNAQELSEIVMPEEVFPPIQRVIDTTFTSDDKTIGYLFRDVKYKRGFVDDVVLSKQLLCDAAGTQLYNTPLEWQQYEQDEEKNLHEWFVASGPLILELCYRLDKENSPLHDEVRSAWKNAFTNPES